MTRSAWRGRRLAATAGFAAVVALVVALSASRRDGSADAGPFAAVRRGDLAIDIASVGELQAVRSLTFNVPRLKTNNVKVTWLVPEGARVAPGDTLARFDPTDVLRRIEELEGRVASARANLEKLHATQAAQLADMEAGLEDHRAGLRLAELAAENVRYEARVNQERAQLELQRARLGLQQAESKLSAQRTIAAAELAQEQVNLTMLLNQRTSEHEALANHALVAATSGLAVYGSNWSGGRLTKIKVGDAIFPGAQVIELPDLSAMKVACTVNEARVQSLQVGLRCDIRVDALADTMHHGVISHVNVLGRKLEDSDGVKVFDFEVQLEGGDSRLRPGMSANVLVRVDVLKGVLFAPVEAVHTDSTGTYVLRRRGGRGLERVGVEVGAQNDFHVALLSGVEVDDALALHHPSSDVGSIPWSRQRPVKLPATQTPTPLAGAQAAEGSKPAGPASPPPTTPMQPDDRAAAPQPRVPTGSASKPPVTREATADKPPVTPPAGSAPATSTEMVYSVHVASYQTLKKANLEIANLRTLGYEARALETDLGSKGKWYRVYAGSYPTAADAARTRDVLLRLPDYSSAQVGRLPRP